MNEWLKTALAFGLAIGGTVVSTGPLSVQPAAAQPYASAAAPSLYVYDFYASWCHNCTAIKPTLAIIKDKYRSAIRIVPVDVDAPDNQELVARIGVQAVPTVVIVDKKGKLLRAFIGADQVRDLDSTIASLLSPAPNALVQRRARHT